MARVKAERETKQVTAICSECKADLSEARRAHPGPVVHCLGYPKRVWAFGSLTGRINMTSAHHGRRAVKCINPACAQILGCDLCLQDRPANIFCLVCETYQDGDVVLGSRRKPIDLPRRPRAPAGIERALPAGDREL